MKLLTFFGIIIWGIVFNSFAQDMDISPSQDSTSLQIGVEKYAFHTKKEVAKTFRPARHFFGARTGIGANAIYEQLNTNNFALDYDVVFRNSPLGLSFSFWGENGKIGNGTCYNLGASGGLLIYIPYSKKSDNTSGFAIKPRLDIFLNGMDVYGHEKNMVAYREDIYFQFPYYYTDKVTTYEEKTISGGIGAGIAGNLGLESRFQVAKNLYLSCGLETKVGAVSGKLLGQYLLYEEHSLLDGRLLDNSVYSENYTLPYISLQVQAGIGFVFRGKGNKKE